jgi:hypothetical protein
MLGSLEPWVPFGRDGGLHLDLTRARAQNMVPGGGTWPEERRTAGSEILA